MSTANTNTLPLILIKKIIKYLIIYDYRFISKLFYLSKNIQTFVVNQINFYSFNEINTLKSFIERNKEKANDQIIKIELCNNIVNKFVQDSNNNEINNEFKNLKEIKLVFTNGEIYKYSNNKTRLEFIENVSKHLIKSNYRINYTTNDFFLFTNHFKEFTDYKVLEKFKNFGFEISIDSVNRILSNSNNLKSLSIKLDTLFTKPYYGFDWFEEDYMEEQRVINYYKNEIDKFGNLLSSTSLIESLSIYFDFNRNRNYGGKNIANLKYFKEELIPSILSSPFQNITKLTFSNIKFPNSANCFFSVLSREKIKKLKLISCFYGCEKSFNNCLDYVNENQQLKQLSLKSNQIKDSNNRLSKILKSHNSLSKLDISFNSFNLIPIFNSINHRINQYTKLTFEAILLPFDYLLNENNKLLSSDTEYNNFNDIQIKYIYRYNHRFNSIILTKPIVLDFKKELYSINLELSNINL